MPEKPKELSLGINYKLKPFTPVITHLPNQRMVEVSIKGDPNTESARVLPPLYASAYGIRKIYKEAGAVFAVEKLRGRWPDANRQRSKYDWLGSYGLPMPNDANHLPEIKKDKQVDGVSVRLADWEYGAVGQILHVGPYAAEAPTIEQLHRYVAEQGYEVIADSHEEIYLSDPQKTAPDKMKTIIMARLRKR
jgi:hypothetical protein